jgi:hypothetical protein
VKFTRTIKPTKENPLTFEDVILRIRKEIRNLPDERVFYTLKQYFKWNAGSQLKYPLACIVLHNMGLTITAPLLSFVFDIETGAAGTALHRLGNIGIITLKQGKNRLNEYFLHPRFMSHLPSVIADVIEEKEQTS